jgi:sporulation integral membrane protein YlbJ
MNFIKKQNKESAPASSLTERSPQSPPYTLRVNTPPSRSAAYYTGRNLLYDKNRLLKGMILLFMIFMLLFPGASFRGASSGLLLWFHNVLPNLLPFIILSNLLVRLNITKKISKVFYPFLGRIFGISSEGCYPVLLGFLSGIPMGAKATADLVTENKITREEGQFLLHMCNNASPMFIIGYITITRLKLPQIKYALFAVIYGSAILSAVLFRFFSGRLSGRTAETSAPLAAPGGKAAGNTTSRFSFDLVDSSIMNGFEIVTRIGGYIILFSILAQIMKEAGPDMGILKAFFMGILEITTGISQICDTGIDIYTKIVLVAALTSFGGFSGIAQTKSVLQDSRLSISTYILVKLINAVITVLLTLLYIAVFLR